MRPSTAIATALMPPLCVIGIGIAMGDWEVAQGSLLLFLTNSVTIAASSTFLFYITGFNLGRKEGDRGIPRSLQISIVLTILLLAPLGWQSYRFVQEASFNREINPLPCTRPGIHPSKRSHFIIVLSNRGGSVSRDTLPNHRAVRYIIFETCRSASEPHLPRR